MLCIPASGILLKNAQWPALQLACMISLVDYHARCVRSVIGWSLFSLKFVPEVLHVFEQFFSK